MEPRMTESTRYLCAAVQIDEKFCDQILEEFLEEDYTVIGICHGVDIPTVLKSCILAKKRRESRDGLLGSLFCICSIIIIFIIIFAKTLYFEYLVPITLVFYFIVSWTIVFLDQTKSRYDIVGKHISQKKFSYDFIISEFSKLHLSSEEKQKLEEISQTQNANVIIYGGYSPFVGSGLNINGWSFAIDITKGKEQEGVTTQPRDFQVSELYDCITKSITSLGLDKLTIEDNLYINGQQISDIEKFLPDPFKRPITRVDDDFIQSFIEQPTDSVRHYKCLRITDWKGELTLSIFLRFSKVGQNLFIEANYYLLTPLRPYYRQYDAIKSQPSEEDIQKIAGQSALKAFVYVFLLIFFPVVIPAYIQKDRGETEQKKKARENKIKEIKSNYSFNYGAITSLRERVSQEEYQRFFQKLDQEMYFKIIERRIVDGLSNFLDSKNIDTSDFKEAKSTILNHGVIVTNGSIHSESIAVGKQAQSTINNGGAARPTDRTNNDGN